MGAGAPRRGGRTAAGRAGQGRPRRKSARVPRRNAASPGSRTLGASHAALRQGCAHPGRKGREATGAGHPHPRRGLGSRRSPGHRSGARGRRGAAAVSFLLSSLKSGKPYGEGEGSATASGAAAPRGGPSEGAGCAPQAGGEGATTARGPGGATARPRPHTHHVEGEGQAEQEEPQVEVQRVHEGGLVRVVVPAPAERGPHPLPEDLQRLRPHPARRRPGPSAARRGRRSPHAVYPPPERRESGPAPRRSLGLRQEEEAATEEEETGAEERGEEEGTGLQGAAAILSPNTRSRSRALTAPARLRRRRDPRRPPVLGRTEREAGRPGGTGSKPRPLRLLLSSPSALQPAPRGRLLPAPGSSARTRPGGRGRGRGARCRAPGDPVALPAGTRASPLMSP